LVEEIVHNGAIALWDRMFSHLSVVARAQAGTGIVVPVQPDSQRSCARARLRRIRAVLGAGLGYAVASPDESDA
jgi:hypothetical protein